jgi:hypothetical protein
MTDQQWVFHNGDANSSELDNYLGNNHLHWGHQQPTRGISVSLNVDVYGTTKIENITWQTQPIKSINQPTNESINQSINQPTYHPTTQPANQPTNIN